MSDQNISEEEGCAILKAVFDARGYRIAEHTPFDDDGLAFTADGWDSDKRVGYEYITDEAGDREEFTPDLLERLEERIGRGDFHFFLVDESQGLSAADLKAAAEAFLDRVANEKAKANA
jgi:hypothetical protein